ncbi:Uncharacterised protein [Raoultella planticola]|uniref:Uncharacterized protein n=1 Tax=Raoultella planticola TaxID=575 RepID=A0A8G2A3R7_RAOPL|nr:Uncharacterised protein [Raoultella planticola]
MRLRPTSITTLSPLTWAPVRVVSRPLLRMRLLPASTVVSLWVVPLPLSLPLPLLALAETLIPQPPEPTPIPTPTVLPLLSFLPSSSEVFSAETRLISWLADSATSLPAFSWLPTAFRSPSRAVILRSRPAVRLLPWAVVCSLRWVDFDDWLP